MFAQETAQTKMGDELVLYIEDDEEEDIHSYAVAYRGLCGYFSVGMYCKTADEARKLFEALQGVSEIDEN